MPLLLIIAALLLSANAFALAPAAGAAPTPPSNCTIVPETFTDGNVGTLNTWFFLTEECSTSERPVRFKVVEGRIPPGMELFIQGVSSGGITGVPTTEGVFAFTIQVRDATGTKDTEPSRSRSTRRGHSSSQTKATRCRQGRSGSSTAAGTASLTAGCRNTPGRWSPASCHPGWSSRKPGADHGHADDGRHVQLPVRVTASHGALAERIFSITIS